MFRAEDLEDYVRAVKAVLGDPHRYRAAYDRSGLLKGWRWEAQAKVLDGIYSRLLPGRPRVKPLETATAVAAEATHTGLTADVRV